jgi:hypothetical protein
MIYIKLPYPSRELNPNVIRHFHQKAKVKAMARSIGHVLACQYKNAFDKNCRIKLLLNTHRKDRRLVDLDNILASLKSLLDGVFDGLGINDNQIDSIQINRSELVKTEPYIDLYIDKI